MARLGPISRLFGFLSHDIAIDLGTANTLVMVRGRGIVIIEPSIVAIDRTSKRILAIGEEAQRMVGRTPANIVAVRPLRDGVISDFEVTERMLSYFIRAVQDRSFLAQPRVVIGIPSGVTEVEKRAVHDAALSAGARSCFLIEEPLAGSVGQIVEAVRSSIEVTPPELVSDLMAHGIALAGGGALLRGLDRRISQETRFPVYVSEDPLLCVVRGAGAIFDEIEASSTVEQQFDSGRARR